MTKGLKTEADLNQFSRMLTKLTVETALNAELTYHLGHEKNAPETGTITRVSLINHPSFPWSSDDFL